MRSVAKRIVNDVSSVMRINHDTPLLVELDYQMMLKAQIFGIIW